MSYSHSLVHIRIVGGMHLHHPLIHRLDLATSSEILELHLGHLISLYVLEVCTEGSQFIPQFYHLIPHILLHRLRKLGQSILH